MARALHLGMTPAQVAEQSGIPTTSFGKSLWSYRSSDGPKGEGLVLEFAPDPSGTYRLRGISLEPWVL